MSSRLQTREASHFLVEFDDENANLRFYVCPRFKILIDGRIRIGEKYLVHWGDKDGDKDEATVLESGEWLDMRRKEQECKKRTPTSPIEEVEPEPEPECNGKDKSPVLKTRPAFSSDNDLAEILKQVEINNARIFNPKSRKIHKRISTARRSLIDAVENESDVPSPLPSHSSRLPDIPLTPSTSHITTLEQRNTFSTTFGFNMSTPPMRQSLTVPYSLFSDIPEQFLISENDLSRAIHSSKGPGNFACHIMPILFPELFTSDNLRTMYTFYGGGKLNKNP
ncbi:unnamed protein product [Mytilus coruscus]|uniref:Uncharacterized protein n=1 Tax=Mytilus coruscus TaxID=42192 RepID=A0A6J8D2Q6_MYTCO|nr:unnamed protein product [Mytilus coruscus]